MAGLDLAGGDLAQHSSRPLFLSPAPRRFPSPPQLELHHPHSPSRRHDSFPRFDFEFPPSPVNSQAVVVPTVRTMDYTTHASYYPGPQAYHPQFMAMPPLTPSHSNSAASEEFNNTSPPVSAGRRNRFFVHHASKLRICGPTAVVYIAFSQSSLPRYSAFRILHPIS